MNRLRRVVRNLTAETAELDAEDLQEQVSGTGAVAIARCGERIPVRVFGVVRALTITPRAGVPAVEAELYDGTGCVTLVWLGRRGIAGVEPGRRLCATGRLTVNDGRRLIYNPRYELVPVDGHA
jgi:hypothetical protein